MGPGDEGTPSIKGISFKESDSWYFDFQDIEIEDDFEDDKETNDDDDQSQSALSLLSTESMESQRVFYAGKRRQRRQRKKDREDQIQNNLLLLSGSTIDSQRQFFAEKQRARQGLEQSSRKKKHLQKKIQIDYGGNAAFVDTVGESGSMHNENEGMILHAEDASFCSQLTEDDGYDYGVLRRRRQSDNLSVCSTPTNDLGNSNQIASQKYYDGFTFGCDKENYTINSMHSHEKHRNAQKKILSPSLKEVVLSANIQTFTENIKAASTKAR